MTECRGVLEYDGCNFLRQRLVLATLSGRSVRIKNIRHTDDDPGLKSFEVNFLKLLDQITNGSKIDINPTGTTVFYQPGLIRGGRLELDCGIDRGLGYFLEPLLCLAPFVKKPVKAVLKGITNSLDDPSVDLLKNCWLPVIKKFIFDSESLDIKVVKRGLAPDGGGEVEFTCPVCRQLKPIQLLKQGKVRKIRGIAFASKVSPTLTTRMIETAKKTLKRFTTDVYIYADHRKGASAGGSPGFGISLYAETTEGVVFGSDAVSNPVGSAEPVTPEDLGVLAVHRLFDEIDRGGCVDSTTVGITCLFMTLCQKDVSKLTTGPLSTYSIHYLRHIRDFFQTMFKIETTTKQDEENDDDEQKLKLGEKTKLILTCVGVGYSNINKMIL